MSKLKTGQSCEGMRKFLEIFGDYSHIVGKFCKSLVVRFIFTFQCEMYEDQLQANVCKCIALRSCFKLKDDNSFTLVSTQTKIHKLILPLPCSLAC